MSYKVQQSTNHLLFAHQLSQIFSNRQANCYVKGNHFQFNYHNFPKLNKLFWTILLLAIFVCKVNAQDFLIIPSSYSINQKASYKLQMKRSLTISIPSGSFVGLFFPQEYSASNLHQGSAYSGYNASNNDKCPTSTNCSGVTLSYSAYGIIISGMFQTSVTKIQFNYTIFNITNPSTPGTTGNFLITIFKGSSLYYPTNSTVSPGGITFTSQSMTCSATVTQSTIWSQSPLVITMTPNNIPKTIQIAFLSSWINQNAITGTILSPVYCLSTTHPTISCNLAGNNLIITNINYYKTLQPIILTINQINNPSQIMSTGPINVISLNSMGQQLDNCNMYIPSTSFSNEFLRKVILTSSYASDDTIQLSFTFSEFQSSLAGDMYEIIFPVDLVPPIDLTLYTASIDSGNVSAGINVYQSNNSVVISPYTTSSNRQTSLNFTVKGIPLPRQAKLITNFSFNSYRLEGYLMKSNQCCGFKLQNRNTLILNSLTLSSSYRLVSSVTYTINIISSQVNLQTTDYIKIYFPPDYSSQITTANNATLCGKISITEANNPSNVKNPTCSILLNTIILTNFILTNYNSPANISIKISSFFVNPPKSPVTGLTVATLSSNNYVLEESVNNTINILANILTSFSVSANSLMTCASNVQYTFLVGNIGTIYNGYFVQIDFPLDFYYINYNQLKCTINSLQIPCSRKNSTYESSAHIVTLHINTTIASITTLIIQGVTNPSTEAPTGTFTATIIDNFGQIVEASNTVANIQMTSLGALNLWATTNNFTSSTTLQSSITTINNQNTSIYLTFSIPYIPWSNTSSLIIKIITSANAQYNGNTTCSSTMVTPTCAFTTNSTSQNIQIDISSITFTAPNVNFFTIQIRNILINNYKNLKIDSTLYSQTLPSLQLTAPVSISTMMIEPVSNYFITQSSYVLGQATSVSLSITLSIYALAQLSSITVFVPAQFGVSTSYTLSYAKSSFISNTLSITGLTNPIVSAYTPFLFIVYDANSYPIAFSSPTDSSKIYSFKLGCNLPCKTCSSNQSFCTACYNNIQWISKIYLQSSTNTCTIQCLDGQYLNNGICSPCNNGCLTCLTYNSAFTNGNGTYCLSCSSSPSQQYLLNNTCYSSCPIGYYTSNNICAPCFSICYICTSLNVCTQCLSSYSLYMNQCLQTCPLKTVTKINSTTNKPYCFACGLNCLICNNSASTQCLVCSNPYLLYNGACILACPTTPQLYPNYNGQCVTCSCLTCTSFSYNCTSCAIPLKLFNYQCLTNCPDKTYPSLSTTYTCVNCQSNCWKCNSSNYCLICFLSYSLSITNSSHSTCVASCTSPAISTLDQTTYQFQCKSCQTGCSTCFQSISYCLSCSSSYLFMNNSCILNCPTNFYNFSNSCLNCNPNCTSCQNNDPYNCTQCSANYYMMSNQCVLICPASYYKNYTNMACSSCGASCATCLNSTHCQTCKTGFLYNHICYSDCSFNSSYFPINGLCVICETQCLTCLTSPTTCSSCSSSSYYFNPTTKACTLNCTSPYYINNNHECVLCQSPCLTCDTTYNSCLSCMNTSLSILNGQCIPSCPSGYYQNSNSTCIACPFPCQTCDSSRCYLCLSYAYHYKNTCVLQCSNQTDLTITVENYCTSCSEVPYCQACNKDVSSTFSCFFCVYPYVVFQGDCLNNCPNLFVIKDNVTRQCVESAAYAKQLSEIYQYNKPLLPPFSFVVIFLLLSLIVRYSSNKIYEYTYHSGYLIAFLSIFDMLLIIYGIFYISTRYQGDYTLENKNIPFYILLGSLGFKLGIINLFFYIFVIYFNYFKDVRYRQWMNQFKLNWVTMIVFVQMFGCRFHKLYYSKLFGFNIFSYRIVSVQKFYEEDILNWILCATDLVDLAAFFIVSYNIFVTYTVLYLIPFELFLIKGLIWVIFTYDLKKPDRGFFKGDQFQAMKQIQQEKEQKQRGKKKLEMDSLIKLIKQKSAIQLNHQKPWDPIFFSDYISVYDPNDYEDIPKAPLFRTQKLINKGFFRKRAKITIEQKLRRFAESIKPTPKVSKDDGYLSGMIYWKPPKKLKVEKKEEHLPPSQQSMLKILEDKQLLYKDDLQVQIVDLEQPSKDKYFKDKKRISRYNQRDFLEDVDETIPNDTMDHFYYPSGSIIEKQDDQQNGYKDLLNLNYARKKHLPQKINEQSYDSNQLRILYHQPKKRRNQFARTGRLIMKKY